MGRTLLAVQAIALVAAWGAFAGPLPAPPVLPTPAPHIRFSGGDGSTCSSAVVIEGASHEWEGVRAQRWWVFSKHPGVRIATQKVSQENGREFDTLDLLTPSGEHQFVCFDITSFYGKP